MIDAQDFHILMKWLEAAFPRWEPRPETHEVYYQVLGDLSLELLKAAVQQYASGDTPWPPSAGQLRALAFGLLERQASIPSSGEAWAEALRHINYYEPPQVEDFSHPLIKDALDAIGGNRVLCMTEVNMLHTARARFIQAYEALLARERAMARMLPQVREVMMQLEATGASLLRPPAEEVDEETKKMQRTALAELRERQDKRGRK